MKYKFIFGNAPELAQAELEAVNPKDSDDPQKSINLLGGTVKIVQILPPDIKLSEVITGDFGVSDLTGKINITKLCKDLKNETKQRFVLPKRGERQLSSVVVAKQKLTELIIGDGWTGKTVAVQDFEQWNRRDYGRPAVEAHIGMLPPKVARMMVNLTNSKIKNQSAKVTILDPFCGVGTILSEAMMVGAGVIGSDKDIKQVERSKNNLEWLSITYQLEPSRFQLHVADARKVSKVLLADSVDAIVTEPFLGPANNQILESLYYDSLQDWLKVLQPGGQVVIALPFFMVDKEKLMGYSFLGGPYPYFRPQAKIRRYIWHIQKLPA
ncbi:MAG: methyltransferase domain-containing protein [Patescibacteria group bacterium]|nr:methyltransferase domain-containing protein [Patescibacteria group bacterium]MCL5431744.1 methyltransferase domain-containing protein [Patescibacteria group bacterium]